MTNSSEQKAKATYSAPALSKGLDILEMMASDASARTLKEIADGLGRSKSEIFRMMHVLQERGYVSLDPGSDQYSLSLKMFEVAHQHSAVRQLSSIAGPVMDKLVAATGQSCHLTILSDNKVMVIAQQDADSAYRFGVKLGLRVTVANSCSGHLFLAHASEEKRQELVAAQAAEGPARLSGAELKKIVDRVLDRGYEAIKSQQVPGVTDMGFPVFNKSGKMVASLVIPFFEYLDGSHKLDFQRSMAHLKKAAEVISWQMGYVDD